LKNPLLLVASICFYAWGAPQFVFVVLGMTTATYYLVAAMDRASSPIVRRMLFSVAIVLNVGMLIYFKYLNFFAENLSETMAFLGVPTSFELPHVILPIGISFYTFETVTYVVDVYRGVHRPLNRLWHYVLYILMFPKLIAGPIVRFHEIADQFFNRFDAETADDRLIGLHRFCLGLGKKVLIANALAIFVDSVYGDSQTGAGGVDPVAVATRTAWLAALAYAFQIYFDFSGYSDMAIGLGRFMGFRLPENFNSPYIAASVTEFWRRWHITLGAWMRNYLYIPLGGNRVSPLRMYLNLWVVFLFSGLWHGASWNFILWGAWHGLFLVCERHWNLHGEAVAARSLRIAATFLVVLFGWVFFRVESFSRAAQYCGTMLGIGGGSRVVDLPVETWGPFVAAVFFSFICLSAVGLQLKRWAYEDAGHTFAGRLFMVASSIVLFTLSLSELASAEFNPFIYFRF
jgi:alginate O-acetyltransferase complex protein AlgI